jgi:phospholipase C
LSNGDGTFRPAQFGIADFAPNAGGWHLDRHLRLLADVTGDGALDIVGFGNDGVSTALGHPPQTVIAVDSSWNLAQPTSLVAGRRGDGRLDIGSGNAGVFTPFDKPAGTFEPPRFAIADFGVDTGDAVVPPQPSPETGFAPRTHSTVIELAVGEERFYRLPPVSRGTVVVKAFHADVSLRAASSMWEEMPATNVVVGTVGPTLHTAAGPPVDDDGGGGPHTDTSVARNLELELRLGSTTMARHGSVVLAESPNHTDAWRLRIRRPPQQNDLSPNPGRYRIETTYVSQLPILQRRVPARFFHDGFELNWNQQQQQYVYGYINDSKVFVYFREDLRQLYNLDEMVVIDTGVPLARANNIRTTGVHLDIGAGPAPFGDEMAPYFSVRVDCAADGEIELPLMPDVRLGSFHVTVRLYLCRRGDGLEYRPTVESELLEALAGVAIPDPELPDIFNTVNAKAKAKEAIEKGIYQLQFPPHSGFSRFGAVLAPWLIGDRRELWSIGYAAGPTETVDQLGIVEPASGDLLLHFVGPRPKRKRDPVVADPDSSPGGPVNDGSIRLYDLPDEEPDPEPGDAEPAPGGGGHVPSPDIGALAKVDHIVVLMMENRSFDQVLGYLSRELGRPDVNGLNALGEDPFVNRQYNRVNGRNLFPRRAASTAWPVFKGPSGDYVGGPCHEAECVRNQMDRDGDVEMARFASDFAKRAGDDLERLRLVMNYFGPDQLPVYAVLAKEFGICDRWYTAYAGPTWPNRFVLFTGDLNRDSLGNVEENNPDLTTMVPIKTATLFDHLNDRGVSWKLFENGFSFIRLFRHYTFDTTNVVWFDDPVRGFEAAARAGVLPQVTMIEPDYIDLPPGNDDHPPADMLNGQDFVNRIVQALLASPQWEKTLLIITYDEHGGFYDHEALPADAPPPLSGGSGLGPRVPTFLVSPWIKRQDVIHTRFDHTSIGATILRRFAGLTPPPSVSERLDAAADLREALTLSEPRPRSEFASIGLPPLEARRSSARRSLDARRQPIGEPSGKDDFHWVLAALRLIAGEAPR